MRIHSVSMAQPPASVLLYLWRSLPPVCSRVSDINLTLFYSFWACNSSFEIILIKTQVTLIIVEKIDSPCVLSSDCPEINRLGKYLTPHDTIAHIERPGD